MAKKSVILETPRWSDVDQYATFGYWYCIVSAQAINEKGLSYAAASEYSRILIKRGKNGDLREVHGSHMTESAREEVLACSGRRFDKVVVLAKAHDLEREHLRRQLVEGECR